MRKLIALFFLNSFLAFSQTNGNLKVATEKFYEANYLLDFETIASQLYPKMVETTGITVITEQIEKFYENDEYRLRQQLDKVPFQFGTIRTLEGRSFCVVSCRNPLRYFFESKLTADAANAKADWLRSENNTKEVTFEPSRNSFNVRKITKFVAVSDESTGSQWRFFNLDDKNQLTAFKNLFGDSIQKELGL